MDTYIDIIRAMLPYVPREVVKKQLGHALNTDDYDLIQLLSQWLKDTKDKESSSPGSIQTDGIKPMWHKPNNV